MTKKPTTDDGFDRATLRDTAQENLKAARERGQTVLNVMEAAAVLRTVHSYAYMTSRLQQIASLMQLGEGAGDKPVYLELCDREGPGCDCEVVCKYKPKHLRTEGEKAFADAELQIRQFFQNEPPNG